MKRFNLYIAIILLKVATAPAMLHAEAGAEIDLTPVSSGTYTITANLAPDVDADFLLDTGASMVMMNDKLFKAIKKHYQVVSKGKVAARMASGRAKTIPVYEIPSLVLSNGCDVGPLEVAVIRGASRNLIGLNALSKLGRLTLDLQLSKLVTTECPGKIPGSSTLAAY